MKKESLIFTTSNPDNRYIRLKGVGRTNNLRNLYLREILGNTQDEQIYDAAKRQRMITAFLKAGVGIADKEAKKKSKNPISSFSWLKERAIRLPWNYLCLSDSDEPECRPVASNV